LSSSFSRRLGPSHRASKTTEANPPKHDSKCDNKSDSTHDPRCSRVLAVSPRNTLLTSPSSPYRVPFHVARNPTIFRGVLQQQIKHTTQ
jgi:hypothetical protein